MFRGMKCLAVMLILFLLTTFPTYYAAAGTASNAAPAGLTGISFKYRQGVKKVPRGIGYSFRQISRGASGTSSAGKAEAINGTGSAKPSYPQGTRYMVLGKNGALFKPAVGDIYIDEANKTAVKVIDATAVDSGGNRLVPVVAPVITDVFENFSVPRQSILPNKMNVENISPAFNISSAGSAPGMQNLVNTGSKDDILTIELKNPIVLMEYPVGNVTGNDNNANKARSNDCLDSATANSTGPYSGIAPASGGDTASGTGSGQNSIAGSGGGSASVEDSGTIPSNYEGSGTSYDNSDGTGTTYDNNDGTGTSNGNSEGTGTGLSSIEASSGSSASSMEAGTSADFASEYSAASDPANNQSSSGDYSKAASVNDQQSTQSNNNGSTPGIAGYDQSTARLVLTKAVIKVYKPVINVDITIDPIKQHVLATMDSQIDVAAAIEGDVQLKREVQIRLYDYSITADKCDLSVGVYLIIGVDGKAHVSLNISNSGVLRNGAEAGAFFGIPLDSHPIGYYQTKSIECGMEVNSDFKIWAAGAPQISFRILGLDIVKMQLWAGLEGNSSFYTDGSAGSGRNSALIRVNYRTSLTGWLLGFPIRVFDTTVPILNKNVTSNSPDRLVMVETANNASSKQIKYSQIKIDRVDAFKNIVEGVVLVDGKPYKSKTGSVKLIIYGADDTGYLDTANIVAQVNTSTGADGRFSANVPLTLDNYAYVKFDEVSVGSNTWGISDYVKAASPFDNITLDADAFNDILKGSIQGKYSDPDGKSGSGDEISFSGAVLINVANDEDKTSKDYTARAYKGSFKAQIPLKGGDYITATIHPFGNSEEEISAYALPNLNALDFRLKKTAVKTAAGKLITIDGAVYNKAGSKPYEGEAVLDWKDFDESDVQTVKTNVQYDIIPGKTGTTAKTSGMAQKASGSPAISITKKKTPSSTFEFTNIKDILIKSFGYKEQHIVVSINYEGMGKVLGWGGRTPPDLIVPNADEAVTNPYDDMVNPVINPSDVLTPFDNNIQYRTAPEINIVTY